MAHLVETMAYANELPWHGLGNLLTPDQPIEVWQREAGMDWQIRETGVLYNVADETGLHLKTNGDCKVLFRSDTHAPLSVVSNRYNVVQPHNVLEFYRDLVAAGGFELETAGVLKCYVPPYFRHAIPIYSRLKRGVCPALRGASCASRTRREKGTALPRLIFLRRLEG